MQNVDDVAAGPEPPERGWLRLLVDPLFGPFIVGKLASTVGMWIHNTVAAIVAFQLTGSALVVGAVSVFQFLPQLVLAPTFGSLADRGDRRRQLLVGRLIAAAGSAVLGILLVVLDPGTQVAIWLVLGAALVVGIGLVVGGPAMLALVPSMVRADELPTAVALNSVPPSLGRSIGPALGALIVISWGAEWGFVVAGVSHAVFALVLIPLRIPTAISSPGTDFRLRTSLTYVRDNVPVLLLLVGVASIGFGADPAITLTPPISDALGGGTEGVGFMASAFGVGTGLGFFLFLWLRRSSGPAVASTVGLTMLAASNLAVALSGSILAASAWFCAAGAGMAVATSGLTTQLQERVPDAMRGRIMGLWSVAFLGTRPLAAAANGYIADIASPSAALAVVALLIGCAVWLTRPAAVRPGTELGT